jgi:excisionase family DNA binding protein
MTVKEVAARLGVAPDWVYARVRGSRGSAPPFKRLGRNIRIPADDEFDRWAQQKVIG